jgi:5-methylcytosine-specific restriction enzyme subunit McrC
MAKVFEDFVVIALREELGVGEAELVQHAKNRGLYLDADHKLKLEPDLSLWQGQECVFVGDVKYKRTKPFGNVRHPDAYQMLAYVLATERRRGLLVYAASDDSNGDEEAGDGVHRIAECDKSISVRALDLGVPPEKVLAQVADLAAEVRDQAADPVHQLSSSRSLVTSD